MLLPRNIALCDAAVEFATLVIAMVVILSALPWGLRIDKIRTDPEPCIEVCNEAVACDNIQCEEHVREVGVLPRIRCALVTRQRRVLRYFLILQRLAVNQSPLDCIRNLQHPELLPVQQEKLALLPKSEVS